MPKSESSLNEILYDLKRIEESREKLTEKKIREIYKSLMQELKSFISDTYLSYADEDGRVYVEQLRREAQYARFLEEVTECVDNISPELKKEMLNLVDETYSKCYQGMADALGSASNTKQIAKMLGDDTLVRPEVLRRAVDNNIGKLTLPAVLEKHRQSIVYDIQQALTIGLTNGDRYEDMVKRVQNVLAGDNGTGGYYGKACNIVRTESHRNIESGFMDCAQDIAQGLDGSDLVYVAIWRTMGDERVRPNVRVKTKKGWITKINKNGADHQKMDGVTIRVGDKFKLESGVYAKNPGESGVARHDCNCRCFLEYDLLTIDEWNALGDKQENGFYKSTKTISDKRRELMNENGIADLSLENTTDSSRFDKAIQDAKKANPHGGSVDTHPVDELDTFSLFLSKNGMSGVAVKPDGDITAVFKNSEWKQRGAVNDLIITARANGGVKMDCYGIGLVNKYENCGYVPVARVPFNAEYVSDDFLLQTKPDVYVLMKNTDTIEEVIKKNGAKKYKLSTQRELDDLPTFEYDDALRYRDKLLKKQQRI